MPQTTDRAPARPCPATGTKPHPHLSCVLCALCACLASLLVVGCSDLGNYDERSVTRQAEGYYAEKYGADAEVVDIWEGRSYVLFGYQSTDMAFCTMDDGTTVLVDFEEGVVGDNRQQDEITAAYERRFREELGRGRRRLEDAGYTVTLVLINGVSPAEDGFFDGCISTYEWGEKDEAERESGPCALHGGRPVLRGGGVPRQAWHVRRRDRHIRTGRGLRRRLPNKCPRAPLVGRARQRDLPVAPPADRRRPCHKGHRLPGVPPSPERRTGSSESSTPSATRARPEAGSSSTGSPWARGPTSPPTSAAYACAPAT